MWPDMAQHIPSILWCMGIAKAIISYITYNAISAIESMWVKPKKEY